MIWMGFHGVEWGFNGIQNQEGGIWWDVFWNMMAYDVINNSWFGLHVCLHYIVFCYFNQTVHVLYMFNQILTINNGDKPIANKIRLDLGKSCLFLAKKIIRGAHLWKKSSWDSPAGQLHKFFHSPVLLRTFDESLFEPHNPCCYSILYNHIYIDVYHQCWFYITSISAFASFVTPSWDGN